MSTMIWNNFRITTAILAIFALGVLSMPSSFAEDPAPEVTEDSAVAMFDNLVPVEDASVAVAYIDPDADFSVFQRVVILEPHVAFVSNWRRDQNRNSRSRVNASDMEGIKSDVASLFREVFVETLQADGGYEVVDETGDDVLIIRPAVIDLDITAPDTMSAGRGRTFTATAGAATVYIELFDSVSGAIIGRAADRRNARNNSGRLSWSSSVMNRQEGRRMFGIWAQQLRTFLDNHYAIGDPK
jgi:hypothetical protein